MCFALKRGQWHLPANGLALRVDTRCKLVGFSGNIDIELSGRSGQMRSSGRVADDQSIELIPVSRFGNRATANYDSRVVVKFVSVGGSNMRAQLRNQRAQREVGHCVTAGRSGSYPLRN